MREHNLSPATFAVLFTLCELGDDEWICEQSERNIAQNVGVARMTVRASIERLIEIHAVVDLGRIGKRSPQRFRVAASRPPTAAQLRLLATKAVRRSTMGDGSWLVSVE